MITERQPPLAKRNEKCREEILERIEARRDGKQRSGQVYHVCERCLLITESPDVPGHYRYIIWDLYYIPYVGLNGVQFCNCSCSYVYCDFEFMNFVFSTLQSRSCFQLTISFVLGGREGSLL